VSWFRACGNEELLAQPLTTLQGCQYLICQDHFIRADYMQFRVLRPKAVPSVFHHNGPLSRTAIEDFCNRNNLVIPVDVPDNLNQTVELDPFVDHAYSKYFKKVFYLYLQVVVF